MADVFLSYRNTPERRALVKRMAVILRIHGLSVWWDYGLEAGESFRDQITAELSKARCVCPFWCSESIRSRWVLMEAELGRDKLIPARLQEVTPPKGFESIQAADLTRWDGRIEDPQITQFVSKICQKLGLPLIPPADMVEEFRQMPTLFTLGSIDSPARPDVLNDLRSTWSNINKDKVSAIMRLYHKVQEQAPGSGLELEISQYIGTMQPHEEATFGPSVFGRERSGSGKIIGVGSGKGGVGKTWAAITLALQLSKIGQKVLLVDGDLQSPNIDVQLGMTPHSDLAAVAAGMNDIPDIVTSFTTEDGGAIDVLPGRSGSGTMVAMPPEIWASITNRILKISSEYDITVVDLPTGLDVQTFEMMDICSSCMAVTTDEPTAMTDTYAYIKLINGSAPHVFVFVAINMCDTVVAGKRTYEAIARATSTFLDFRPPLAGIVLRDPAVRQSIRSQIPLDSRGNSRAYFDMEEIALFLVKSLRGDLWQSLVEDSNKTENLS